MMMVSLLSGINLGVVKAEEIKPKPDDKFDTAGKTFTLIKEWDVEPEEGTEAEFILRAKYLDKNAEPTKDYMVLEKLYDEVYDLKDTK